ncbi:YfiR/HmsC family protein [Aquimarina megaterium]|uniref:YfiR/HmsC family protein n=1 Tax=Aquimarina megaterium TaxID=1443666 RepID=UPI0009F2990E|nr:YfiR/HmsC family protein [Aquimarina megaterium]
MMYKRQYISTAYTNVIAILLCILTTSFSAKIKAQETSNEEVKRLQRAIFVFNFAQQIGWPTIEEQPNFKIGVLGPDRTILDLKAMSLRRKIHGKPVEIVRFQFVKNVKDIQLLYVNHKYNYDMHYILSKISGKNIMLVGEDYNFNASMINMVNVGDSFEYEINESRIEKERFTIAPTLGKHAITSSEKWKRLYRKTEKTLNKVQEDKDKQEAILKDKEKQIQFQEEKITDQLEKIDSKEGEINRRNKKIESLYSESEIQQKKYKEKVVIERELEKNIQEQVAFIKSQEEKIIQSNREISEQNEFLEEQKEKIKEQENVLNQQASELYTHKKVNILLIALVLLTLTISFFVYRNYRAKKKYNQELKHKNQEIYKQSVELEAKNKELEQFAYIASHDLQEPLNTISSFIGLLAEDYGENFDEAGKESMTFIQDASVRMKKLIDALLEYSRLGRSKEYDTVDCNTLIQELKKDLKVVLEKTETKIRVKNLPVVNGSEIELRLLFQNLISNGIKFSPPDTIPEIDIACVQKNDSEDASKGFWEFSVKDNGIGIPKEHQERIFAIFQRLHSRDKYEGTGIGLAHCKKIVEAHGGKIWLTSKEKSGSTFYFTIPF